MLSIPTINLVALAHLSFVSAFVGLYLAEATMELYAFFFNRGDKVLNHSVMRLHYWIDNLVEIPIIAGFVGTGIWMAFLVDELTMLHIVKIGCVVFALSVPGSMCLRSVNRRYKLLKENAPEDILLNKSRNIIYIIAILFNPFVIAAAVIGCWLAYNRVLESIYG